MFDATTDPALRSWVLSANRAGSDFPIQNLPFGVFRRADSREAPRVGTAIGDSVLDIAACLAAGLFDTASDEARLAARSCASPTLNALMARGPSGRRALRDVLSQLLSERTEFELVVERARRTDRRLRVIRTFALPMRPLHARARQDDG